MDRTISPEELFVIREDCAVADEVLYWSNRDGFVSLETADLFPINLKDKITLPVGGRWVPLTNVMSSRIVELLEDAREHVEASYHRDCHQDLVASDKRLLDSIDEVLNNR